MARLRSILTQSPAILIASAALVFSLGSSAGYAASQATASTTITFHKLHLINGWAHSTYDAAADPAYAVSNGVVYLTGGVLKTSSSKSNEFAVLPPGARPKHNLILPVYNNNPTEGNALVFVSPSGKMDTYGPGDTIFQSLDGVSFPLSS
jgi:hypothetical protein